MANTSLRVTELDYMNIRENLKNYLKSQNQFTDYDFDGSGMSVLLDLLAYNTHYMGYYLNMVANEMFMDSAQLRNSLISHAKNINYVPTSRQGAQAKLNILVTPSPEENQTATTITLDKYTRLLGEDVDGVNYGFVAINSNSAVKTANTFSFSNVVVRQGEVVTRQFLMDDASNPKRRFTIPSANVDLTTLTVRVQKSTSNSDTKTYTLADDLTTVYSNTQVFFVEEDVNRQYALYFGDDYIGKKPDNQSIVMATYLESAGTAANNISKFRFIEPIGGLYTDNVSITTVTSSRDGTEKESLESIRFRAPHFYTAQNRMVTKNDYETLLLKDYQNIESISVWGGEDNEPPVYGKTFISIKTAGNYALTEIEKQNIKDELIRNRSVLTVTPEIVEPNYIYLLIRGHVYYNQRKTSKSQNEILQLVRAAISDYISDNLNSFGATFRKSKLMQYIENAEDSISGSDINVYVQARVLMDTVNAKTYTIDFNMPLKKGDYNNRLYTFPQIKVYDSAGVIRNVFFEEVPESFTGIDSVEMIASGFNYDSVPTVTINGDGTGATAKARVVNGSVVSIEVTNRGINYSRATVSITGGGGSQAVAQAKLEAKNGKLRTFYFKSNGEKIILDSEAATIDYELGRITVKALTTFGTVDNSLFDANILAITAFPENQIIEPLRNRIITLDETVQNTIDVEVIAQ
jgi:hypothetical protein